VVSRAAAILIAALGPVCLLAQEPGQAAFPTPGATAVTTPADWRRIGSLVSDGAMAGPASGRVDRVWYSPDGSKIGAETHSGRAYETADLETWAPSATPTPPSPLDAIAISLPEAGATVRRPFGQNSRLYAFREFVYRSDNGGRNWDNVVIYQNASILGGTIRDLAVSPDNEDEIVAAGDAGVFRSTDAGRSWSSMNATLPNLPASRILAVPANGRGARIATSDSSAAEWPPGEKQEWVATPAADLAAEASLRSALSSLSGTEITAVTIAGEFIYAGSRAGDIRVSADRGASWGTFSSSASGAVERFWVSTTDPRIAAAVIGAKPENASPDAPVHVLHTMNGGALWDNVTANLPDVPAHGIAADLASGAIYVANDRGVFMGYTDLASLGSAPVWTQLSGLPAVGALDVKLDAQGHQLWVALDGLGVYAALAPHRRMDPKVVSAADLIARAAAPGSLITVLGAQIDSARSGVFSMPVLASAAEQSQIQVPFEIRGTSMTIAAATKSNGPLTLGPLALTAASPAIFVDRDGAPMVLDADSGLMLDATTPARSGSRIQILATGLGRVTPDWPTGVAAPLDNAPSVAGAVHAYLDRVPIEVTRATLAPGYVGFYLIEVNVPKLVNYGPAELYVDVDGAASNRAPVYIEP